MIAQISDVHLGGPNEGSGDRFSDAIDAINSMTRRPDLVLVTGDLTHTGSEVEWDEFRERVAPLCAPWDAVRGNHDRRIDAHVGHRSIDLDGLHVVLLDTSTDEWAVRAWIGLALDSSQAQLTGPDKRRHTPALPWAR